MIGMPTCDLIVVLFMCGLAGVNANHTMYDIDRLKKDLFNTTYDVSTRPVIYQSKGINKDATILFGRHITNPAEWRLLRLHSHGPATGTSVTLVVRATYRLFAINHVDEVKESLTTTGYLNFIWLDQRLRWNPADYGGATMIRLQQNKIWKPDVVLKNSVKGYATLGDESLMVEVLNNGYVAWYPTEMFTSTCKLDITYFPYDKQTCYLKFVAWSYTKSSVWLKGSKTGVEAFQHDFEPNSEWDLVDTHSVVKNESFESEVRFAITIQRKASYSIMTLVLPVILLNILNLFVFVLPYDGGEKNGYAVTVFLAFVVLMTILEASFPPNSETVSYFSILIMSGAAQSTTIAVLVAVMTRFSANGEKTDAPAWFIAIVRFTRCQALRRVIKNIKKRRHKTYNAQELTISTVQDCEATDIAERKACDDDKTREKKRYTWKYCIDRMDAVFFTFFLCTFVTAFLYFFISVRRAK